MTFYDHLGSPTLHFASLTLTLRLSPAVSSSAPPPASASRLAEPAVARTAAASGLAACAAPAHQSPAAAGAWAAAEAAARPVALRRSRRSRPQGRRRAPSSPAVVASWSYWGGRPRPGRRPPWGQTSRFRRQGKKANEVPPAAEVGPVSPFTCRAHEVISSGTHPNSRASRPDRSPAGPQMSSSQMPHPVRPFCRWACRGSGHSP